MASLSTRSEELEHVQAEEEANSIESEIVRLNNQLLALHQENAGYKRKFEDEKDKNKVLSLKISDLQSLYDRSKSECRLLVNSERQKYQEEAKKLEFVYKKQVDELKGQICSLDSHLERVLKVSAMYFKADISNIDQLIANLNRSFTYSLHSPLNAVSIASKVDISAYEGQIDDLKQLYQNERAKYESIAADQSKKVANLEQENQLLREKVAEKETQIVDLTKNLAATKSQVIMTKAKCAETQQIKQNELIDKIQSLNEQITKLSAENDHLCKENDTYSMQKATSDRLYAELKHNFKIIEKSLLETKEDNARIIDEMNFIKSEAQERVDEYEATNIQNKQLLDSMKSLKIIAENSQNENEKLKIALDEIQHHFDLLSSDYSVVTKHKNSLQRAVDILFQITKQSCSIISNLEETNIKLAKDLQVSKNFVSDYINSLDNSKLIPLAAWSSPNMPPGLVSIVQKIAESSLLPLPSKLTKVLFEIVDWYSKTADSPQTTSAVELFELNSDLKDSLREECQDLRHKCDSLQEKLAEAVTDKNKAEDMVFDLLRELNVSSFPSAMQIIKQNQEDLTKCLKQIEKYHTKLESNKKKFLSTVSDLNELIKERETTIMELKSQNKALEERFSLNEDLNNHLNVSIEAQNDTFEKYADEMKEQAVKLKTEIRRLQDDSDSKSIQITNLKKTIEILNESIQKVKLEKQKLQKLANTQKHEKHDQKLIEKLQKGLLAMKEQNLELQSLLANRDEEIKAYSNKIETKQQEIKRLLDKNQENLEKIKELSSELSRDRAISDVKLRSAIAECESAACAEQERIKSQYSEQIMDLLTVVGKKFAIHADSMVKLDLMNFDRFISAISSRFQELVREEEQIRTILGLRQGDSVINALSVKLLDTSC